MDNVVTLFEYGSKKFEIGDQDFYDEENDRLTLTSETIEELKKLSEKKLIEVKWKEIKALNYVGVIKAGGITIEILPKFLKDVDEHDPRNMKKLKDTATKNLLKMLEFTQRWRFKEINYASLEKVEHDFFEILISLFAKNLLSLLKVKQNYEYVRKREELRFVKGRMDFARYTNPARLHIIPCIHYERSMDNLINRTLKYTCYLLSRITKTPENRLILRRILDILDGVTLTPVTLQEVNRITFNRLNADFKPFIDICKLILEGSTLTLQASKIETFSLMIPMEKLFEEFIAGVIQGNNLHKKIFGDNARLLIQHKIGHLAEKDGRKLFEMIPDIVIKVDNEIKLIIDTKYKLLDPDSAKLGVSQQDLYQIYAYCKECDAKKALLLYPANLVDIDESKLETPFKLGERKDVEVYVRTVPLDLDLTSDEGFKDFVGSLEGILKIVGGW